MKKVFIILLCLMLVTGCSTTKSKKIEKKKKKKEVVEVKETYKDENNMPISFYDNNKKITTEKVVFQVGRDLGIFQIFPSNGDTIGNWNSFYDEWVKYDPEHKVKIGYNVKYSTDDGNTISHTVVNPSNTMDYAGYIALFLYDDYNNRGKSWYSHVEEKDFNENTFLTSIKLFADRGITNITSDIVLTVFTYDTEDDFDPETKEYRGNSKASITIAKQ